MPNTLDLGITDARYERTPLRRKVVNCLNRTYEARQTATSISAAATIFTFCETLYIPQDCYAISFVYGNHYQAGGGGADVYVGNQFTITSSLEPTIAGTTIPATFLNATSYQFPAYMATKETDMIWTGLAAGSTARVRTCVTVTDTNHYIPYSFRASITGGYSDAIAVGSDMTVSGTPTVATAGAYYYGPMVVLGYFADQNAPVVIGVCDSIGMGNNDGNYNMGPIVRMLNGNTLNAAALSLPFALPGHSGSTLNDYGTELTVRNRWLPTFYGDIAIVELGVNDRTTSLATIKTRAITLWRRLRRQDLIVVQCTIGPVAGSSDSWATLANQVPSGYPITSIVDDGAGKIRVNVTALGSSPTMPGSSTVTLTGISGPTVSSGLVKASGATGANYVILQGDYLGPYTIAANATIVNELVKTNRTSFNDWVRGGAPINPSTFAAMSIGESGAVYAGHPSHPLTTWKPFAEQMEVDINGVATINGGYWKISLGQPTADGIHPEPVACSALSAFTTVNELKALWPRN